MDFPLSREIVDQIIFAMEDQSVRRLVSTRSGAVVRDLAEGAAATPLVRQGEGLIPTPRWWPADGFRLMEGFVGHVTNPIYQEQLRAALAAGRGVFRNFKDVLKQSGDLERSWYRFKENQMRAVVVEWYEEQREFRGLERLGHEPDERPEDAAVEFSVTAATVAHQADVRELDRDALMEEGSLASADPAAYREWRELAPDDDDALVLVALTAADEVAAMVWAHGDGAGWELVQLAVRASYRSLGLAERLLDELRARALASGVARITAQLDGGAVALSEYFERRQFTAASIRMELALEAFASTFAP